MTQPATSVEPPIDGKLARIVIPAGQELRPIEVEIVAKLPPSAGKSIVHQALEHQLGHENFVEEYNEVSALVSRTDFSRSDSAAIYTFGVEERDLVFHRHAGHRIITAVTGAAGCILRFSLCSPEEAATNLEAFFNQLHVIRIPADRMFVLRFDGQVYHQFCPASPSEKAFFAVSVHTDEAKGLTGELLARVLADDGNIPMLTEPAPDRILLELKNRHYFGEPDEILLDI